MIAETTEGAREQQRMPAAISAPNTSSSSKSAHWHRSDLGLPEVLVDKRPGGPGQAVVARLGDVSPG